VKINDWVRVSWVNSQSHPDLLSGQSIRQWCEQQLSMIEVVGTLIHASDGYIVVAQIRTAQGVANMHKIPRSSILRLDELAVVAPPAAKPQANAPTAEPVNQPPSEPAKAADATRNGHSPKLKLAKPAK